MLKNLNITIQWREPPNSIRIRREFNLNNIKRLAGSFIVTFAIMAIFILLVQMKSVLEHTHKFGFLGAIFISIFITSLVVFIILFIYKNSRNLVIFYEGMIRPNIFEYWSYSDITLTKLKKITFRDQEYNILQMFSKNIMLGTIILDNSIDTNLIINILQRKDISIEIQS